MSVAIVYLSFAAALIVSIWALATVVVDQTKTAANRFDTYFTEAHGQTSRTDADRDVDRLQHWLNTHGLSSIKIQERGHRLVEADPREGRRQIHRTESSTSSRARRSRSGSCSSPRSSCSSCRSTCCSTSRGWRTAIDRRFPPHRGSQPLLVRMEHARRRLREGPAARLADHRRERGLGPVVARGARVGAGRGQVRAPLRRLGGGDGADPVPRPVARGDPGRDLRGRRRPDLAALGDDPLPRHPPGRRPHRRAERDGQRASRCIRCSSSSACSRAARSTGCRGSSLRCRCSRPPERCRSSSPSGSRSSPGRKPAGRCRSRWRSSRLRRAGASKIARLPASAAQNRPMSAGPLLAARGVSPPLRRPRRARSPPTSRSTRARCSRSSARTARASRRCWRSSPARCRRAAGSVERGDGVRVGWMPQRPAHYGRLSARAEPRALRPAGGAPARARGRRCSPRLELPDDGRPTRRALGRQPPAAEPRDLAARRPAGAAARRADGRARPAPATAASGRPQRRCGRAAGAVVLVTQNVEDLEHVADRVAVLLDGRVVFDGSVAEYLRSEAAGALA